MIKYTVQYGQSMWDVAIQRYGHVAGVYMLVEDNPDYAITDVPVPGSVLLIRPLVPKLSETNEAVVREYSDNNITVASSAQTNRTAATQYVATGYWATGYVRQTP